MSGCELPVVRNRGLEIRSRSRSGREGTEFIGGWLTGPLLNLYDVGTFLFVPALLLAFFFRRIAAAFALTASLLCLPLYLYFVAPGPFRSVFRGEYSVPLQASFVWNSWASYWES